jgi:hypothetical protein
MPLRRYHNEQHKINRYKHRADRNMDFITTIHGKGDESIHGSNMQVWLSIKARRRKARFLASLMVLLFMFIALGFILFILR